MRCLVGVLAAVLLASSASPAAAQYFGRNKVQYESFKFHVLKTEHFDVYFYPSEQEAAAITARMAERWYTRLSSVLDHTLSGRQPLILYASQAQFQQTNAIPGELGEGTGGVTEALRRRIVLPTGGTLGDLDHVIGHELVHAFQYDMTGMGRGVGVAPVAASLPLWLIEGMAEYLSIGPNTPLTAMWMRGALQDTTGDSLPTFGQLEDPRFFPYRYGHAFLAFIAGHWGDQAMGQLLRTASRSRDIGAAIAYLSRVSPDSLVARWHAETRAAFGPLERTTQPPDAIGRRLIAATGDAQYNVAPALSPDGSQVMFFSNRGLFSIDLFLADAHTGKIKRQITKTAVNPHLQSLQFIQSAGSWSLDGRRFAFAGITGGRPLLTLYNVEHRRVEREIRLPKLDEIVNPSWSPDARSVVFSGLNGGLTDLYIYDLESNKLTRLTDDHFADLQPVWSPDGRTIAFATDRFTTDLETLAVGRYRLALLDVATGQIRPVPMPAGAPGAARAKWLNPQWSPDGRSLYFLSDPDGITNIYRLELASGQMTQVTNLFTGVSGITETSPAFTVAQRSGQLVFTMFRSNGHELYTIDEPATLAGRPVNATGADPAAAVSLPPRERERPQLAALLADPRLGLPTESDSSRPYSPRLGLTYVGQPTLVAGASQFGTFVGGGTAFYFSDILGNRNLVTELQIYGNLKDLLATVAYQNLSHRLNWGLVAQQVPYRTGTYGEGFASLNGQQVFVQQQVTDRQINRETYGLLSYPFDQVRRLDFSFGYSNISFDRELRTLVYSTTTGQLLQDDRENLPAGEALNLAIGSLAWVYDNSFFGATSPILGQRYRFEIGGTAGTLNYTDVLLDYRRYFLPVRPFTLAMRLLHYGRYGSGGEDPRLQPLFIGYPGLVRGYTYGSFSANECAASAIDFGESGTCPVYDQLLGSRMAVASAELRFPLLGVLGVGSGYYGALPLEFLTFADAGLAWDTSHDPKVFGLDGVREPVKSAGVGLRMNVFGFAIAELDLVHPFDRPEKNWIWQLELQPGF